MRLINSRRHRLCKMYSRLSWNPQQGCRLAFLNHYIFLHFFVFCVSFILFNTEILYLFYKKNCKFDLFIWHLSNHWWHYLVNGNLDLKYICATFVLLHKSWEQREREKWTKKFTFVGNGRVIKNFHKLGSISSTFNEQLLRR